MSEPHSVAEPIAPYFQPREGFLAPGSDRALAEGCICPVLDNNHGRFPVMPPSAGLPDGGWYVVLGCPVHRDLIGGSS